MELAACNILVNKLTHESSDSTVSSDSDSDIDLLSAIREKHVKIHNYFSIISQYSDFDFKSHFRLSRSSIEVNMK